MRPQGAPGFGDNLHLRMLDQGAGGVPLAGGWQEWQPLGGGCSVLMEWEASQAGLEEGGGRWPGILQGWFEKVSLPWLLEPLCSPQCEHLSRAAIPSRHFIRQRRVEKLWGHQTSHHLVQCKATEQFGSCPWCSGRKGKQN